jgi:hypothetical protein
LIYPEGIYDRRTPAPLPGWTTDTPPLGCRTNRLMKVCFFRKELFLHLENVAVSIAS